MPTYINKITLGSVLLANDGLHMALPDVIVSDDHFIASSRSLGSSYTGGGPVSISGVASVNAVAGAAFLVLIDEANGLPVTAKMSELDGSYTFNGLPAGEYAVVEIDPAGAWRGKVIHTEVA